MSETEVPLPLDIRSDGEIGGVIDKTSPVPFYYQLRQLLEQAISSGVLGVDHKIPTEAALCERYDVSRTVVRQALSDLEHTGLVVRQKGRGTFVAAPKLSEFVAQTLTSLHEDLSARGEHLETTVLRLEVEPVSPHVARMTCWMWMFHGSTLSSSSTLCSSEPTASSSCQRPCPHSGCV